MKRKDEKGQELLLKRKLAEDEYKAAAQGLLAAKPFTPQFSLARKRAERARAALDKLFGKADAERIATKATLPLTKNQGVA